MKSARNFLNINRLTQILKEKNPPCQVEKHFDERVLKTVEKRIFFIIYEDISRLIIIKQYNIVYIYTINLKIYITIIIILTNK